MVYLRTSEKEFLESEERKIRQTKWRLRKIRMISSILGGLAILCLLYTSISGIEEDVYAVMRSLGPDVVRDIDRCYLKTAGNVNTSKVLLRLRCV